MLVGQVREQFKANAKELDDDKASVCKVPTLSSTLLSDCLCDHADQRAKGGVSYRGLYVTP